MNIPWMTRILQAAATGALLLATLGAPATGRAQHSRRSTSGPRIGGAIDAVYARPTEEFLQNVKQGFGLGGYALVLGSDGTLALRADVTFVRYGHRSSEVIVGTGFQSFQVEQDTDNDILTIGVGPQLMVPYGPIRPYVNAHGGFSHFVTQSRLNGLDPNVFETTFTESSDWKLTYGAGGGVYLPLTTGRFPLSLDLGVQYHVNGRTTYLTRGDIKVDTAAGTFVVTPRRSEARFLTFRLGVAVVF